MSNTIKTMTVQEFADFGFLQEVNRRFLHPRGVALSIKLDEEKDNWAFGPIWDYRDHDEGMLFGDGALDTDASRDKRNRVEEEYDRHCLHRAALIGTIIQEIPHKEDDLLIPGSIWSGVVKEKNHLVVVTAIDSIKVSFRHIINNHPHHLINYLAVSDFLNRYEVV